jgi:hypothetical protein
MHPYFCFKFCTLRPIPLFNYIYNYYRKVKVNILPLFTRSSNESFFPLTVNNTVGVERLIYDINLSLPIVIYIIDKVSFTHSFNQSINQSIKISTMYHGHTLSDTDYSIT